MTGARCCAARGVGEAERGEQACAASDGVARAVVVFGGQCVGNERGPVLRVVLGGGSVKCFAHGRRNENGLEELLTYALELHVGVVEVGIAVFAVLFLHARGAPDADEAFVSEEAGAGEIALLQTNRDGGNVEAAKAVDARSFIRANGTAAKRAERKAGEVAEEILLVLQNTVELADVGNKRIIAKTGEDFEAVLSDRRASASRKCRTLFENFIAHASTARPGRSEHLDLLAGGAGGGVDVFEDRLDDEVFHGVLVVRN